ncbi:LacI family DNA-binding transcriptional regulator [Cellulomonas soli]|uniref:LacI family DNA-binding transcriptional regulator n=1 Tax=Cellulomonas soli TaxID=931535 RepID=UPI0017FAAFD1|nr:LacI family DNA-binding transcriptional regulator [Cellulomonas soli]NYI60672.1 DNA-binding LacI/PurR family transcriptional regulator [Cellulomonas soli]
MARAAGVSIAVVSYALNGRPGVSAATRERVLRVADEFGWRPSAAARSMRSGPRAVGLVVDRAAASPAAHATAVLDLVTSLQDVIAARGFALLLQVVDDADAAVTLYGSWWAERRFDVMVVTDVLARDPRLDALRRLRAPAVVVGPPQHVHELASVHVEEADAYRRVGRYLLELGHRDVAAVTGPAALLRTRARLDALTGVVEEAGGRVLHEATAATPEDAAAATRRLLTSSTPPTALVHDSDQMALAALDVARRTGREVPWDLSVVAGGDSALCRLSTPSITTLPSAQCDIGTATGEVVLAVVDGDPSAARTVPVGGLAVRGSTGPRAR